MTDLAFPDEQVARAIVREFSGQAALSLVRFAMGIGHWVYDVRLASGDALVVRVGAPDQAPDFAGATHWSTTLRPRGAPLPEILGHGKHRGFPYLILERLAGVDLGLAYDVLSEAEKRAIAARVVAVQGRVAEIGEGRGFGYVRLPDEPGLPTWRHVIDASIERSRARMIAANGASVPVLDAVSRRATRFDAYFARVRPVPFLDDTTTKNVLVHEGQLTGVVDVDWICFGDPLLTVALTRASLLSSGRDDIYTRHWAALLEVTEEQQAVIGFYTALFYLDFRSELGHRFNRDAPTLGEDEAARLENRIEEQLRQL